MNRIALTLLALAGCPASDDKVDDSAAVDLDGDGVTGSADCDEFDETVYPGAPELCDGKDNDCDGVTDPSTAEDAPTWYADADHDGRGDLAVTVTSCDQPDGYVASGTDCDDDEPEVYPGNPEVCDGLDNDCDGDTDPDTASGTSVWFLDADADSYGDGAVGVEACDAPPGYVEDHTDCDDLDPDAFPGNLEVCDGVDNDCDGEIDPDGAPGSRTWHHDADGDGYGDPDDVIEVCEQPAGYVEDATDCDDTRGEVNPGATEVCNGRDDDCDADVDPSTSADAATWYGDGDGDGYAGADLVAVACSAPSGYGPSAVDCDDGDSAIHPGATEVCDGADNNCDGTTDPDGAPGSTAWYADTDGDGYGDPDVVTSACSAPRGYVADDQDCDDGDRAVNPAATEVCDGDDNDCDGRTDPSTASGAPTWYRDADSDGYGTPATTTTACTQPSGYVSDATDCEDGSAAAHPGGTEVCDGYDNDCDGTTDPDSASGAPTWYADADADGYGDPATTRTACAQPGGYVATGDDCGPADSGINPGAEDIPGDGIDQDCNGVDDSCADYTLGAVTGSWSSTTVGAGNEYVGSCGGTTGEDETWYWVAPTTGYYRLTTNISDLDSVMYVLEGDCSGTEVGCNDDMRDWLNSDVTLYVTAGAGYVIVIDSWSSSYSDPYTLTIEQLDPADCTTGLDTDGDGLVDCNDPDCASTPACDPSLADANLGSSIGSPVATGSTSGRGNDWGSDCASTTSEDYAYAWIAPSQAQWSFTTLSSSFDTVLTVVGPDGTELDCNDDVSVMQNTSRVLYTPREGELLLLVVDGYSSYTGTYYLRIYE